jgi:hypothetical protein
VNPIDRVLSALRDHGQEPRKAGAGWSCRCPAHDDRNPSLSIHAGDDGRALVNCHAGCAVDAVCGAVGLRVADLFIPDASRRSGHAPKPRGMSTSTETRRTPPAGDSVDVDVLKGSRIYPTASYAVKELEQWYGKRSATWTYHNAAGEPVGLTFRRDKPGGGKVVRHAWRTVDGCGWVLEGGPKPHPLYGLPALLAMPAGSRVWVCEGEKATDAARAIGLVATTSAGGAERATGSDWSPMRGQNVVVSVDHDKAGEKYGEDVARLCMAAGALSVRIVRLVELWAAMPAGGDVADLLEHRDGDVDPIRAEVEALAAKAEPEKSTAALLDGAPVVVRMADVESKPVEWLWPGRIPRRCVTVLAGRPGDGKSFATADWAARVSTGRAWPDGTPCEAGDVLLVAGEDDPETTLRPRLDAHGADVSRVHLLRAVNRVAHNGKNQQTMFTLADLPALEMALAGLRAPRLVIIDPIGSFLGGKVDANRDNEVRAVLAPVSLLAERYGLAVLVVAHHNKSSASHADDLILGSRAFTGLARSVLHLMLDPEDKDRRLLLPGKVNVARKPMGLAFRIDGEPARLAWETGPVDQNADGVLAAMAGRGGDGALDEAREWLRDVLSPGPQPAIEVKARAEADGIKSRTLDRAKKDLGVMATREGFGSDGRWVWYMPHSAPTPTKDAKPGGLAHNEPVGAQYAARDSSGER